jgi:L-seryl-tRNA(Ser) seleniumtransferase
MLMDGPTPPALRDLPQVQRLLEQPQAERLAGQHGRASLVAALRTVLDAARASLLQGGTEAPRPEALLHEAATLLDARKQPHLCRIINATGIILHTNLGRAPLPHAAIAAAVAAAGYCNLEYDLETGARGRRGAGAGALLCRITGAEAGLAVNNCAAAVLLALSALAGGGEVIVSRGELVEIGGGFRIPDVIQQGGARLVEVGTTNKTRLADYERAITPATRVLLRVHQSNFAMTGFTESTPLPDLVGLARSRNLRVVHDLGSGALDELPGGLEEATVLQSIAAGVDVVAFSGDKLLGGPQAGVLAGRAEAIDLMRRHPLLRALRLDKLTLAALEATLRLHADGEGANIPALRMMGQSQVQLGERAERLAALVGPPAQTEPSAGYTGGGTLPAAPIPSMAVSLAVADPQQLAARLRAQATPVIGRIAQGRFLLDMLTVESDDIASLAAAIRAALA